MRSSPRAKRFTKTNMDYLMATLMAIREATQQAKYCKSEQMNDTALPCWKEAQQALATADAAIVKTINALGGPLVIDRSITVDGSPKKES